MHFQLIHSRKVLTEQCWAVLSTPKAPNPTQRKVTKRRGSLTRVPILVNLAFPMKMWGTVPIHDWNCDLGNNPFSHYTWGYSQASEFLSTPSQSQHKQQMYKKLSQPGINDVLSVLFKGRKQLSENLEVISFRLFRLFIPQRVLASVAIRAKACYHSALIKKDTRRGAVN